MREMAEDNIETAIPPRKVGANTSELLGKYPTAASFRKVSSWSEKSEDFHIWSVLKVRVCGEKVERRSMNCETLAPSPNSCFQGEMGFGRSPWNRTERAVSKTTTSGDWA